jgi:peptidoglycan/LPS O-acetylase OafA/YrhL
LYNIRHVVEYFPLNPNVQYLLNLVGLDWFHVSGLAAGAILALCINRVKFQNILNWQPFLFLGKISYGIYLTHWLFINCLLMPRWDYFFKICGIENKMLVLFQLITITGSVFLSTLLYYIVEKPFINWGRKLV